MELLNKYLGLKTKHDGCETTTVSKVEVGKDQTSRQCSTEMAKLYGFFYVCFPTTQNNRSAEIGLNFDFDVDASREAEAHQHIDGL